MPLLDAKVAEILGADGGGEQGLHPLEAAHREQAGVGQAGGAGDQADDALHRPAGQLDQCVDADVAGGAHAVGQAEEDQPGEQRLGQRVAPGHRLGQIENGVADGEEEVAGALEAVAQAVEQRVQVVEDDVDERHQGHGRQQEDDEAFLETIPDQAQGVHGRYLRWKERRGGRRAALWLSAAPAPRANQSLG
ncbi:hypothetical protein D3C86_1356210 [compost metagenome]